MVSNKPKALIIEQSASSIAGHYLEYAKRISSALRQEYNWEYQIEPVILHVRNSL